MSSSLLFVFMANCSYLSFFHIETGLKKQKFQDQLKERLIKARLCPRCLITLESLRRLRRRLYECVQPSRSRGGHRAAPGKTTTPLLERPNELGNKRTSSSMAKEHEHLMDSRLDVARGTASNVSVGKELGNAKACA
ncbi:MAG: hypothetical protein O7D30_05005 [Rickettsia endosymbiont of Ixodes persulcatus]|nr:hypothetical protein [Rickettsia endosymbiont of Ixodes persulcatus]